MHCGHRWAALYLARDNARHLSSAYMHKRNRMTNALRDDRCSNSRWITDRQAERAATRHRTADRSCRPRLTALTANVVRSPGMPELRVFRPVVPAYSMAWPSQPSRPSSGSVASAVRNISCCR
jgi:hypothetical protein